MIKEENKDNEQFVYKISHDLKEPLTTIVSYAQLLREMYKNQLDQNGLKYLDTILHSAHQLNSRIAGLAELSRVGRGQEEEKADCNSIVLEVLKELEEQIKEAGAKIEFDKLPELNGYPKELKRLFKELITNAVKFRKKDVKLQINITCGKRDGFTEFSVTDNGIGMDTRKQDKIFTPFYKLSYDSEGGVGLALCKKVAELHGGAIKADCETGKGCAFTFTIK